MNNQSSGRNQRPRGFKVRWAFQFSLFMAVCIWLLYQTKHSHDTNKHYSTSKSKLTKVHNFVNMGRKGNAGWSDIEGESGSEDLDLVEGGEKKQDGGAGDDELDRNVEEKAEEESNNKDDDSGHGGNAYHRDKEDEREQEGQYKEFQTIEETNSHFLVEDKRVNINKNILKDEYTKDKIANGSVTEQDDRGDEKVPETKVKAMENAMNALTKGKDEAVQHNDEVEGLHGVANATAPSLNEKDDTTHSFHDENGVPQDIMESMPMESRGNRNLILHREIILSSNNQGETTESTPREGKEFELEKITNTADSENESRGTLEDSKTDKRSDATVDSDTSVVSNVNYVSDTAEERSLVTEDASSVSSQQKQEAITTTSMSLQAE